jgi:hypothetical protein
MDINEIRYYGDYSPPPKVEKRLGSAREDYQRKAPLRDILGILEDNEAWSKESGLAAKEIYEKINNFDNEQRTRPVQSLESTRTVRDRLKKLQSYDLVFSEEENNSNKIRYWKEKDANIPSYWKYKLLYPIVIQPFFAAERLLLDKVLLANQFTKLSIYFFIISSLSYSFNITLYGVELGDQVIILAIVSLTFGLAVFPFTSKEITKTLQR